MSEKMEDVYEEEIEKQEAEVEEVQDDKEDSSTLEEGDKEDSPPLASQEDGKTPIPYGRFKEVNDAKKEAIANLNREREARYELERRLAALEQQKLAPKQEIKKPNRRDFDYEEDYFDAMDAYNEQKLELKAQEIAAAQIKKQRELEVQQKTSQVNAKFNTSLATAQEKMPDIMDSFEYVKANTPSAEFARALVSSSEPAKIINYLAKNPKEMSRIAAISDPIEHIRAIGQLEARMETPQKPTRKTKAPEPITPLESSDSEKVDAKVPKFRTQADYYAWRKKTQGY